MEVKLAKAENNGIQRRAVLTVDRRVGLRRSRAMERCYQHRRQARPTIMNHPSVNPSRSLHFHSLPLPCTIAVNNGIKRYSLIRVINYYDSWVSLESKLREKKIRFYIPRMHLTAVGHDVVILNMVHDPHCWTNELHNLSVHRDSQHFCRYLIFRLATRFESFVVAVSAIASLNST